MHTGVREEPSFTRIFSNSIGPRVEFELAAIDHAVCNVQYRPERAWSAAVQRKAARAILRHHIDSIHTRRVTVRTTSYYTLRHERSDVYCLLKITQHHEARGNECSGLVLLEGVATHILSANTGLVCSSQVQNTRGLYAEFFTYDGGPIDRSFRLEGGDAQSAFRSAKKLASRRHCHWRRHIQHTAYSNVIYDDTQRCPRTEPKYAREGKTYLARVEVFSRLFAEACQALLTPQAGMKDRVSDTVSFDPGTRDR